MLYMYARTDVMIRRPSLEFRLGCVDDFRDELRRFFLQQMRILNKATLYFSIVLLPTQLFFLLLRY